MIIYYNHTYWNTLENIITSIYNRYVIGKIVHRKLTTKSKDGKAKSRMLWLYVSHNTLYFNVHLHVVLATSPYE